MFYSWEKITIGLVRKCKNNGNKEKRSDKKTRKIMEMKNDPARQEWLIYSQ